MDLPARVFERVAASSLALLAFTFAADARADKEACARAAESYQELRDQGHLQEGRNKLLVCASAECPKLIRTDCTNWLEELTRTMPSISVQVDLRKDDKASDLQVFLDGKPVDDKALGSAIPLDPGKHRVRAVIGKDSVEREVLVAIGEKNKAVLLQFETTAPDQPKQPPQSDTASQNGGSRSVGPYILAGGGVASLVVFGVFQAMGRSQFDTLESGCGKTKSCAADDVSSVRTKFIVSGVALTIGAAAILGAVGWYIFDTPSSAKHGSAKNVFHRDGGLYLSPSLNGAEAGYSFRF